MTFKLDPRLAADGILLTETSQYVLNLANDSRYVWLVLIPKVANAKELYDLSVDMQTDIAHRTNQLAKHLSNQYAATKINIAAIGNIVPQLHVHIVVRQTQDAAWPDPIWGKGVAKPYSETELEIRLNELQRLLKPLNW